MSKLDAQESFGTMESGIYFFARQDVAGHVKKAILAGLLGCVAVMFDGTWLIPASLEGVTNFARGEMLLNAAGVALIGLAVVFGFKSLANPLTLSVGFSGLIVHQASPQMITWDKISRIREVPMGTEPGLAIDLMDDVQVHARLPYRLVHAINDLGTDMGDLSINLVSTDSSIFEAISAIEMHFSIERLI